MINQNLRISELQHDLKDYIDVIDLIHEDILGTQRRPFINDKKRLGQIHHALNIENYAKHEFRNHLLEHAPTDLVNSYLQKLGLLTEKTIEPKKYLELIKQASSFKWGNNSETIAFIKCFGYDDGLIPIKSNTKDDELIIKNSFKPLNSLWEYQSKIFFKAIEFVEISSNRFIITMPTGAGKTRTAMEILINFLNNGTDKFEPRQILWIAEKKELCEQAVESFLKIWPHLGKTSMKLYRFWEGSKSQNFEKNSIIVSTYAKLRGIIKKNIIKPDLIICDEAHSAVAKTHKLLLEKLSTYNSRIIGLTATPIRTRNDETEDLIDFFYDNIIEMEIGDEENTIEYLQKRGFLSYYNAHTIDSTVRFKTSRKLLKLIEKDRDLPDGFLQEIANNQIRNLVIAKLLYQLGQKKIKVLYFAPSIKQSKLMCALLLSFGFNAAHLDSNTPPRYRQDVITKFRNGDIKILCNFGLFTTGFDDPKINAIVIGRPTTSLVLHTQMIGRGMRGKKMGGTKTFDLYRINDEMPGVILADSYFKDIWH